MKVIILIGGSGERLWPISRELYPKSLLRLYGEKTLLQNTYEMALEMVHPKNIISMTNVRQTTDVNLQLKKIYNNPIIISEPMAKNTAPAVASALTYIKNKRDETVVILPVDFSVDDKEEFLSAINKAKILANNGYIAAIGVRPLYPETGYGYIKAGSSYKTGRKIEKFIEKPSIENANKFIEDKDYFWNCGIYVAKVSVLIEAFQKYAPEIIANMNKEMFDENNKIEYINYEKIPSISIDYAIIEKSDNLAVVELNAKWQDYGSWQAIYNNEMKDKKGNVVHGNVLLDNVKDSFVYSSKELVAVSGMNNIVVIETEDAILVCNKDKAANIDSIVKKLKKKKSETTQLHKTVFRPWGYYTCLNGGQGWLTKIINVSPGHKLSLQSHNHRSEHWVVLEGSATVILDGEKHVLQKRQSINIPVKAKHSLQNLTRQTLKILEVQKGEYISEDDIIRYEDMYGRVK